MKLKFNFHIWASPHIDECNPCFIQIDHLPGGRLTEELHITFDYDKNSISVQVIVSHSSLKKHYSL